jgi:alanyl-tRNA synthetase
MTSIELKQKFIKFFESKGHKRIQNSSVIPENDPSALFINSGMHPIVPYLMGQEHPAGKRLVNYQRAIRTGDIEEVGVTKRHNTFFEMLGEWSLGDYWKKESLEWTMEFLVKELGFDPTRLYATVFKGNENIPRDDEAIGYWKTIFQQYHIEPTVGDSFLMENSPRIITLGEDDNFWAVGKVGPCGPNSEIYYDCGTGEDTDTRFLEVCNNVFMSYYRDEEGKLTNLSQQNIDVGWGFERVLSAVQGRDENGDIPANYSNFETDLFSDERDFLLESYGLKINHYELQPEIRKSIRVLVDHIRASVIIIADEVEPSNKDQGYILRRLIRRAVTFGWKFSAHTQIFTDLASRYIEKLSKDEDYKHVGEKREYILEVLNGEIKKFETALKNGIRELDKVKKDTISGEMAFRLKEALGLPLEITEEIASHSGKKVDHEKYNLLMQEHQDRSRTAAKGKFVGGLGDFSPESIRYHTCAHLFLAGAQKVLGDHVHQKGQNITPERLRYDISHPTPITPEELQKIEDWVNEQIEKDLKVDFVEVSIDEAKKMNAEGVFGDKYEALGRVKVYRMYDQKLDEDHPNKYVSIEICGGPHVEFTSEIKAHGRFKISKEESSGGGVRRIKAILIKQ